MDYCEALFLHCLRSKEWELIVSRLQHLHPGQWRQKHTRTFGQNFRNLYLQTRIFKPIENNNQHHMRYLWLWK